MANMILLIYIYITYTIHTHCWPWQIKSILPTDLIGAQVGIWNNNLHLINGVYNATRLNYSADNNNLVLWLTTDLSNSISLTSAQTSTFLTSPTPTSWDITATTNSLGGFFCFSKCSAQIDEYLYVISPESTDTHDPTGYLIVYNLATQQIMPPPQGLTKTPYYLNGGACVVHNGTHLFSLGGYNTQCPSGTGKFHARCNDPDNILIYDTINTQWIYGAVLPETARIDSGACAIDNTHTNIYLFGGYDKDKDSLSDNVIKYHIYSDTFDVAFRQNMLHKRSEFNALVDTNKNHAYLIGGAITVASNTGKLIEVYDMNSETFIDVSINGLPQSIRWYGSAVHPYNENIDLLLVIGGHTGGYSRDQSIKQEMTDYVQYLTVNKNIVSYTTSPTVDPTVQPTTQPTIPSKYPSVTPTVQPTLEPSLSPTDKPTDAPTTNPTKYPSINPTMQPTHMPSVIPTFNPTEIPTDIPTQYPSLTPTNNPTMEPTYIPSLEPTYIPSESPTLEPTINPTLNPTNEPTITPTNNPTQEPTWAPFTPAPSITHNHQFVVGIDVTINCTHDPPIPALYPPTVTTIIYDLLEPKYEKNPNLWVNTDIIQSIDLCNISIDSEYTTNILTNAIQLDRYANTTLTEDIIIALHDIYDIEIDPHNIEIRYDFQIIATPYPTSEPSLSPTVIHVTIPDITDNIIYDGTQVTDMKYIPIVTKKGHSFNYWLYGENNLNWIIILIACCLLFPFCFVSIWWCNRCQTQKLLKQHKREIQKFQTLSQSIASPERNHITYDTYQRRNMRDINEAMMNMKDETDSESSDVQTGDGYTHISPILEHLHNGDNEVRTVRQYTHVRDRSDFFDGYEHVSNIMNNYQNLQMQYGYNNEEMRHKMSVMPVQYMHDSGNSSHLHMDMDGSHGTTDEMDGSTTDYRYNTGHNCVNEAAYAVYNESEVLEFDIHRIASDIDDYKQDMHESKEENSQSTTNNSNNVRNIIKDLNSVQCIQKDKENSRDDDEDYLVVKGMGLTPSLMPLKSGYASENISIAIKRRNNVMGHNNPEFDDYKISVSDKDKGILFENEELNENDYENEEEISDSETDNVGGDEFQSADSNVFSPPNYMKKYKKISTMIELSQMEMNSTKVMNADMDKESENEIDYANVNIVNNSLSMTINTINSEEENHENTFELK